MGCHEIMIEAERCAAHKATEMHRPVTKEWESTYNRIRVEEYNAMTTPPAVCSHCGRS